jgi:copper chaperone
METTVLRISGMTCGGCVASVKRVLQDIDGVRAVDVSLERAQATVEYDPARTQPARFRSAIEEAGYDVA